MLAVSVKRLVAMLDSFSERNRANLGTGMVLHRAPVNVESQCRAELEVLQAAYPQQRPTLTAWGNVRGDFGASRPREALSNLVTYTIKHGTGGVAPEIRLEGNPTAVIIHVENAGEITEPDPAVLFEPLRRGVSAQRNTERTNLRLGLFITRQISRAHGGDVHIASESGRVRFTIILPKAEQ